MRIGFYLCVFLFLEPLNCNAQLFSHVFESDMNLQPTEITKISRDSFIVGAFTIYNQKRSHVFLGFNAINNNTSERIFEGYEGNSRSLLKRDSLFYFLGDDNNGLEDSLVLLQIDSTFQIVNKTKYSTPGKYLGQFLAAIDTSFIYGGSFVEIDEENDQMLISKVEPNGNLVWHRNYFDELVSCFPFAMCFTEPGDLMIGTEIDYVSPFGKYAQILKLDTNGNVIFRKDIEEAQSILGSDMSLIELNGNEYIVQYLVRDDSTPTDFFSRYLILDNLGQEKLNFVIDPEGSDILNYYDLRKISSNEFYSFGKSSYYNSDSLSDLEYALISRLDNQGNEIWRKNYKHPDFNQKGSSIWIRDLLVEDEGTIVVLAWIIKDSKSFAWLFRLDSDGCSGVGDCGDFDFFSSVTNFDLPDISIFPNPASDQILISSNSSLEILNVELFNSSGILLKRIENILPVDLSIKLVDYSNGIYWLRIRTPRGIYVRTFFLKK